MACQWKWVGVTRTKKMKAESPKITAMFCEMLLQDQRLSNHPGGPKLKQNLIVVRPILLPTEEEKRKTHKQTMKYNLDTSFLLEVESIIRKNSFFFYRFFSETDNISMVVKLL